MRGQERPPGLAARNESPLDLRTVLVVVAGHASEVAAGDAGEAPSEIELVVPIAESTNVAGIDPGVACGGAAPSSMARTQREPSSSTKGTR